jgi:hypothetical protein
MNLMLHAQIDLSILIRRSGARCAPTFTTGC